MTKSLDALLEHADARPHRTAFAAIRQKFHRRHRQTISSGALQKNLAEFVVDLKTARKRVRDWKLELRETTVLALGFSAAYRGARKAARWVAEDRSADTWHEWRKRAKVYGYHLALLRNARESLAKAMKREVDELTDLLGEEHDLAVLRATLKNREADWGKASAVRALIRLIDARRRELRRAGQRAAVPIFADKPSDVGGRMLRWWQHAVKAS